MAYEQVIFLDLDGVMITHGSANFLDEEAGEIGFNIKCVNVLNQILEQTDAEIVITSSLRRVYSLSDFDFMFKINKVIKSPISVTPHLPSRSRSQEIASFILENNVKNFVIFDDMNIVGYDTKYFPVYSHKGLIDEYVPTAVLLLCS